MANSVLLSKCSLTATNKATTPGLEVEEKSGSPLFSLPFSLLPLSPILPLGIVELCAKFFLIMRNDFKDYARTFCQLCAPFSVQISINQERK